MKAKNLLQIIVALIFISACITIMVMHHKEIYREDPTIDDSYSQIDNTTILDKITETTEETTIVEETSEILTSSNITETNIEIETIVEDGTSRKLRLTLPTSTRRAIGNTFYYDDGEPVYIDANEYYVICGIVMNEAGADYGSYEGRVAVAQCIRNQIIREKKCGHPYDIVTIRSVYGEHTTKTPSDEVRQAVTDVFYNHIVVTEKPIIAWCTSRYRGWHSSHAEYVCSYGGNDFYKLYDNHYLY